MSNAPPTGADAVSASKSEFPSPFGRYLLLKRLSRGGMGEIFLAKVGEIQGFEKFVIIKKILPQLAANEDFISRFIDEAQVAIKLNHVNIAQVYEVGRVDGEYFLAIEFIDGRDVRRILRRCRETGTRLPVDLCLFIARDLAAGLAYAHRRQVAKGQALMLVHCDISPPNVMVSFEGEVKVIDFGIARSALRTADSNPNIGFGKFGYMAPEQLVRGGVIDRRTDIYAAGVVLYELLTGERLYQFPEGTDYRQMARAVCQGNYLPPSARDERLDASIDAILARALAVRQEQRYQLAEEFRDALQHKLSRLNPTISADRLSKVMDELFSTDRLLETDEFAQMRAVDASVFKDDIAGGAGHTVTFARANVAAADEATTVASQTPEEDAKSAVAVAQPDESDRSANSPPFAPSVSPTKRKWLVPTLAGALAVAMVLVWFLRPTAQTPPVPPPVPPVQPEKKVPTVAAETLDLGSPDLAPSPTPPPLLPTADAVKKTRRPSAKSLASATKTAKESKESLAPEQVDRKFKEVKAEYLEFKSVFGARLEGRWQEILSEIALGRRDPRVSEALDALRKEMKASRAEKANP